MSPAPPLKRLLAFIIDTLTILAIIIILSVSIHTLFMFVAINANRSVYYIAPIVAAVKFWVSLLAILGYLTISNWYWGSTVGKSLLGLRVVEVNEKPLSLKSSIIRSLSYILTAWTYGIGFFIGLIRKDRLTLHDFVSNTKVCSAHEDFLSFDTKSLSDTDLKPFAGT